MLWRSLYMDRALLIIFTLPWALPPGGTLHINSLYPWATKNPRVKGYEFSRQRGPRFGVNYEIPLNPRGKGLFIELESSSYVKLILPSLLKVILGVSHGHWGGGGFHNLWNRKHPVFWILEHRIRPRLGGLGGNLPPRLKGDNENPLVNHGGTNFMECPLPPGLAQFSGDLAFIVQKYFDFAQNIWQNWWIIYAWNLMFTQFEYIITFLKIMRRTLVCQKY